MDRNRTILPLLEEYFRRYSVTIITGPRLVGKRTIARAAFGKKASYLYSFDDPELRLKALQDPKGFLTGCRGNVILSEVQRVPELLPHLSSFVNANIDNRLVLLSSQRLENRELIPADLAWQVGYVTLMPFGVEEIPYIKEGNQSLSESCWYGGYPRMLFPSRSYSNTQFSQYLQNYIEQDVRQLKSIVDTSQFLFFMKECALRVGQLLNLTAIAKECGIAVNTAKAWLQVLETGYMVYRLPPYKEGFGRRVVKVPKLYFCDTGLLCFLLGIKSPEDVLGHVLYTMIAENFMMNDLMRLFHHRAEPVTSVYFWRDHRGFEVDCLIEHAGKLRGIDFQSCTLETEIDFKEIERWGKERNSMRLDNFIVYGGKAIKQRHETWVFSWEDVLSATNGVLVRDLGKIYHQDKKPKKKV